MACRRHGEEIPAKRDIDSDFPNLRKFELDITGIEKRSDVGHRDLNDSVPLHPSPPLNEPSRRIKGHHGFWLLWRNHTHLNKRRCDPYRPMATHIEITAVVHEDDSVLASIGCWWREHGAEHVHVSPRLLHEERPEMV